MLKIASFILAAGLACSAFAMQPGEKPAPQPAKAPTPPPAGQPTAATPAPVNAMPAQPAPPPVTPVPVPDMPAVETHEVEGIKIEDLKMGEGPAVQPHNIVVAYYHGTLKSDGSVFDSAFDRGQPIPFSLDGVIQGWQKGVPGMKNGGVRRLTIPAALAYGAQERPKIPANSDLVFVIQLVDFVHMEEITPGTGDEAGFPCVAVTEQTIKDKDGKEISKSDKAKPYIWIPGEMQVGRNIDAFQSALDGMKVGGKRKIHIPKEVNTPNPMITNRPTETACDIEVELVAVRNLQPKAPK